MFHEAAPFFGESIGGSEDRLSRRCAEAHDNVRRDQRSFRFEPRPAGFRFRRIRLLVNPAFPSLFELEVLDCVCNVYRRAVNSGVFKGAVEEPAGGSYKRPTLTIFLVPWLLTNKHDRG
jgi:hypothetical protein